MKLELFYYEACPFCQVVLRALDELKIEVELLDIWAEREYVDRLLSDTGRRTVPCLYIDNKPMFESADIVQWLRENQETLRSNQG